MNVSKKVCFEKKQKQKPLRLLGMGVRAGAEIARSCSTSDNF
jgi:hypothetical protein